MGDRPDWDEYFMRFAHDAARRSTCLRRTVGAVVVINKRIVVTGYNGPPPKIRHCEEKGGCERARLNIPSGERSEICNALHAEQNCIIQAAIHGASIAGGIMYTTTIPCTTCAKMIIGAQISEVVFGGDYPDNFGIPMIEEAKIILRKYDGPKIASP